MHMDRAEKAARAILEHSANHRRVMVAIAGPPASGKSTLAHQLALLLPSSVVVPADGFHYDDAVLGARGWQSRKGAPHTFDVSGLEVTLKRIRACEPDVAIPIFDRNLELSRAAGAIVEATTGIILVEGLYLLLDADPWRQLSHLFDVSIFLDTPREELVRRLRKRWQEYGREDADNWIESNDLPNVDLVLGKRLAASLTI